MLDVACLEFQGFPEMKNGPLAAVLMLITLALCSCQHVPPHPIHQPELRMEIENRLNRLDDVRAYAASLSESSSAQTDSFNLDDGLTLHEATLIALWYNGDARLAREEVVHARIRAELAGLLSDPQLGLTVGERQVDEGGPIDKALILGSRLSITIPVSGRRGSTRALRASEYQTALLAAEETEWRVAMELRQAYLEWAAAVDRVALLQDYLAELSTIAKLTRGLANAGELDIVEARFFEIEHSRLTASLMHEQELLTIRRLECLQIMGMHPDVDIQLIPEPWTVDTASDSEDVHEAHPVLVRLESEYAAAEDALRLEIRKQFPDITLSPGIMDEEDETSLQLGLGFPLPVWNANRLGIAEAVAHRHDIHILMENEMQRLISDLAVHRLQMQSARERWRHLNEETMVLLEQQADQAKSLLDSGELDMTHINELLNGLLNQSLALKRELIDVRLHHQLTASAVLAATEPHGYESVLEWENTK